MAKDCQHMTGFVTPSGSYEWRVMPFGLKNASATFQRLTDRLLKDHQGYTCGYIDDIESSWQQHLIHIDKVLATIAEANLTVNLKKCKFASPEVKYLGHVIGSGCCEPDRSHIEVIASLKRPTSKKELRRFLGICNYYRMYIQNYSELVRHLTNLTKNSVPNELPWNEDAQRSFDSIKHKLVTAPVLMIPDINKPFLVQVDASQYAVGSCISQRDDVGLEHPVAYGSQKLTDSQVKWATIEKEAYAVIWALKRFDTLLYGANIEIISDHNPLSYLVDNVSKSAKLTRWALALQRYKCTVKHKSGVSHGNADMLSRS